MMNFYLVSGLLLAYLVGSIPTSVWIGRIFYGIDIRQKGSGNAGATNTIRVLGWKAGVPVLLFDVFKGWFAVHVINFLPLEFIDLSLMVWIKIAFAAAAVLGHIFPLYIGFRGGKGVATLLGVGIALYPVAVWFVVLLFVISLLTSRIVSLSSIIASASFPLIVIIFDFTEHIPLIILSIAVGVFVPLTHLSNIKRLLKGEEKPFSWHRKSAEK